MDFAADLHVHSRFSRATSRSLSPETLAHSARCKGLTLLGSGDFTHPGWLAELEEKLEPAEAGLFKLKPEPARLSAGLEPALPAALAAKTLRFLLSAEIACIYKAAGRTRKVHNLVLVRGFEEAKRIRASLERLGANLRSDGRPIIGMDSRDLLELCLEAAPDCLFVPAHIWTPWFSMLGSQSGFDSVKECFRDLEAYIYAVETGLSSDPPMNWACSFLDRYSIVSNSDAHSAEKLGREASLFECELSYDGIALALKSPGEKLLAGTVEFFPEEGKYHLDGHRACAFRSNPAETRRRGGLCPVCGKPLTVGVLNRAAELSDRDYPLERPGRRPFHSLIPLGELLSELLGLGVQSKKVEQRRRALLGRGLTEFDILLKLTIEEIGRLGDQRLAEAIRRMRAGEVQVEAGYDGEYGRISVFGPAGAASFGGRELFEKGRFSDRPDAAVRPNFDPRRHRPAASGPAMAGAGASEPAAGGSAAGLSPEQLAAVEHGRGPLLILAGPGTGKTRTLVHRIAGLVQAGLADPDETKAISFTNKAADELVERLRHLLPDAGVWTGTFHRLGLAILEGNAGLVGRREPFGLLGEEEAAALSKSVGGDPDSYRRALVERNAFDFDSLISEPARLLEERPELLGLWRRRCGWLFVDEYQDVNAEQYRLIRLLAGDGSPNLCVIGDPDQAIYGFRGADAGFIGAFRKDYPDAALFRLKQSHRSTGIIASASILMLSRGDSRPRELVGLPGGVKLKIAAAHTDKSEAEFAAREIENLIGGIGFFSLDSGVAEAAGGGRALGRPVLASLAEAAVLCRTKRQLDAFEKAFRDHNLPFQRWDKDAWEERADDLPPLAALGGRPYRRGLEAVSLLSLHAAKGLEFECVFIAGCEDGLLPFTLIPERPADPGEERRLFYVGMTRARRLLYLTRARRRFLYGRMLELPASPFLSDIERELAESLELKAGPPAAPEQFELF